MMLPEARDSLDHHRKGPASRTRTRTTNRPRRRPVLAQDVDLEGDVGEEGVERQTCTARNYRAVRVSENIAKSKTMFDVWTDRSMGSRPRNPVPVMRGRMLSSAFRLSWSGGRHRSRRSGR